MRRTTIDRHAFVLGELRERKHVLVSQLAESLDVSESTVRRDLRTLAKQRELELVHGGATLPNHVDFSFNAKQTREVEAKRVIGELAAELVADFDHIFLDSGTTCLAMLPHLRERADLCVIANSARIAREPLAQTTSLILLGGQFRTDRLDLVGPIAAATLEQLHGFVAFIGADGVSMEVGPTASDPESAHINRLAVRHAREAILLVDHSKLAHASVFRIVDWKPISRLVTDREPPAEWREFLDGHDVDLVFPESVG